MRISGRDFVDLPRLVAKEIKADNLENPLSVSPGTHIGILSVAQFRHRNGGEPRLFQDFADGSLLGFFTGIDQTLGQGK